MFIEKDNKTTLNISLADKKGIRQIDPVEAYKILDKQMKDTDLKYEIYHKPFHIRGRESFMPFEILELVLHDADDRQVDHLAKAIKKLFPWKSPFDEMK